MKRKLLPALCLILCLALCPAALAFDASQDSRLLVLVNKTHLLPAGYAPETQLLADSVPVTASSTSLRPEAAQAYIAMYQAMRADGVPVCKVQSGFRSYATQRYLVNQRVGQRMQRGMSRQAAYEDTVIYTAPAGASEHQTGLAIDCGTGGALSQSFSNTPAGRWMAQHAWEYGFILRYEADKSDLTMIGAEAWHYRYVGVPHAKFITDNDLCYEEYIDYLHANGSAGVAVGDARYAIFWTDDTAQEFPGLEILDISSDNAGGWIITAACPADPLFCVRGHRSEKDFLRLEEMGAELGPAVLPDRAITGRELAGLCGLEGGSGQTLTREEAAAFLAPYLPDQELTRLAYADLDEIGGAAFQGVQTAVANGLFPHAQGRSFRPKAPLTWGEAAAVAVAFRGLHSPVRP